MATKCFYLAIWLCCLVNRCTFRQLSDDFANNSFVSIWNAPTSVCERKFGVVLNLSHFDIVTNDNDTFQGDAIVIFYKNTFGLFPWIRPDGSFVNGGLPQLANVDAHLRQVADDVAYYVPEVAFSGFAVIDWEQWRPIFDRNGYNDHQKIYIRESENIVRRKHPEWTEKQIKDEARIEFENAARSLLQSTLALCRKLRPHGYWGYYGFPHCYNKPGHRACSNSTIRLNNRLSWLFGTSSAIVPSIYLQSFGTALDKSWHVYGQLKEAWRVKQTYGGQYVPIVPYTRYRYDDTGTFYNMRDLQSSVVQAALAGMNGIVFWDSSESIRTKDECLAIRDYLDTTLGPLVENVTSFMEKCSQDVCNDHGRCVNSTWMRSKSTGKRQHTGSIRSTSRTLSDVITCPPHVIHNLLKWGVEKVLLVLNFFNIWSKTAVTRNDRDLFHCICFKGWHGEFCQELSHNS